MLPAELVGGGNKHLQRRIARPRPRPGQAGVNAIAPLFHRDDRVRHPEAQIMMGMHPGGGLRLQHRLQGAEAVANVVHVHRPAGIHQHRYRSRHKIPSSAPAAPAPAGRSSGSSSENRRCPSPARGQRQYAAPRRPLRCSGWRPAPPAPGLIRCFQNRAACRYPAAVRWRFSLGSRHPLPLQSAAMSLWAPKP